MRISVYGDDPDPDGQPPPRARQSPHVVRIPKPDPPPPIKKAAAPRPPAEEFVLHVPGPYTKPRAPARNQQPSASAGSACLMLVALVVGCTVLLMMLFAR